MKEREREREKGRKRERESESQVGLYGKEGEERMKASSLFSLSSHSYSYIKTGPTGTI